ncbi:MAG: HEPN domain-containing protein [Proteobacteria bacterium]|nr:HEPN domain-containing protein [Pseudomonadota bacterium]
MTDLTEILSHLPENKVKELEIITQRIVDTGKAEIVVLFGSYSRGNYKVQRGVTKGKKSDYDILVVTSDTDSRKELRSELRAIFKDIGVPVQLIVEDIDFVNSNLEEKQYFFTDIKREGKVLFNSGKYELADSQELAPTRRREIAEEDFKDWFGTAKKIMASVRTDFRLAAFDLQQVAEMCYTAIEMVFTHYNPYEHNLDVLRNRTLLFDRRVQDALPYETEAQQELFDYLNFAYIGGRYRSEKEFPVSEEQLDYWSKEVKKLLGLTETICKERIECLKEIEQELETKN